ncbi:MAG: hypothetical protein HQL30_09975 [Candidatus Omnitrophica bacterium]|nr:hypothetical protein [Candidatus Omnitrophota bacterium]
MKAAVVRDIIIRHHYYVAIISLAVFVFLWTPEKARSSEDGFQPVNSFRSRYFNISIENGVDARSIAMKIAAPPGIASMIPEPVSPGHSDSGLSDQIDLLFLAVSEIMDLHLNNTKCELKICKDRLSLSEVASRFRAQGSRAGGFYSASTNTLYIDAEDVTVNIMAHELSHVVQTNYFVVTPPEKTQEILAGYVEYQFRKYTNTLPRRI